tara:strand:+ start:3522 stop:3623 length:102 start_codon:yes stop_codon:yes gene_type:complete
MPNGLMKTATRKGSETPFIEGIIIKLLLIIIWI